MYARLASYGALALASAWAGWTLNAMVLGEKLANLKTEYAQAQVRAVERAHAETIRLQSAKDLAEKAAERRQSALAAAASAARTELGRVQDAARSAAERACEATDDAETEPAFALADVFNQCAAELTKLGEIADRHASDVRTLMDAFPKEP